MNILTPKMFSVHPLYIKYVMQYSDLELSSYNV